MKSFYFATVVLTLTLSAYADTKLNSVTDLSKIKFLDQCVEKEDVQVYEPVILKFNTVCKSVVQRGYLIINSFTYPNQGPVFQQCLSSIKNKTPFLNPFNNGSMSQGVEVSSSLEEVKSSYGTPQERDCLQKQAVAFKAAASNPHVQKFFKKTNVESFQIGLASYDAHAAEQFYGLSIANQMLRVRPSMSANGKCTIVPTAHIISKITAVNQQIGKDIPNTMIQISQILNNSTSSPVSKKVNCANVSEAATNKKIAGMAQDSDSEKSSASKQ